MHRITKQSKDESHTEGSTLIYECGNTLKTKQSIPFFSTLHNYVHTHIIGEKKTNPSFKILRYEEVSHNAVCRSHRAQRARISSWSRVWKHTIHIYVYVRECMGKLERERECVCVCVCVCAKIREKINFIAIETRSLSLLPSHKIVPLA